MQTNYTPEKPRMKNWFPGLKKWLNYANPTPSIGVTDPKKKTTLYAICWLKKGRS